MAWLNPATWTIVDTLQGQNKSAPTQGGGYTGPQGEKGFSPLTTKLSSYKGATPQPAAQYEAANYSTGGAGNVATTQQNIDLVNSLFGAKKAGLQGQLGTVDAQYGASQARIGNQYQTKFNDLQENLSLGKRNLGESRNTVNEERARSLQDIRDKLQSQSMGYANQLGTMGAGDSSAAGLVNTALSGMASKNRGAVQENASGQLTTIDNQEENLTREYQRNARDLESWKQEQLSNLATQIMQTKQQIQQAIAQADADQASQLAQYDASYTQQAIAALQNLQNTYAAQSAALADRYNNALAPQSIQINPTLQQYAVKPIDEGTLRNLEMPTAVNPEAEAQAILRKKQEEEQANAILNPVIA